MRRHVSIIASVGLAATMAAAGPAGAVEDRTDGLTFEMRGAAPTQPRAGAAEQLVSATATFATRVPGMPASTAPHQQLLPGARLDISYGYHWETGVVTYHFEARPASAGLRPGNAVADYVGVGMGVLSGTTCQLDTVDYDGVSEYFADHLLYGSGDATEKPNAGLWDCAALFVENLDGSATYDAYVSPLTVTTAAPQLSVTVPRKDRLVKGVWTRIPVTVANAAAEGIDARDVVVTGAGKGVKVRRLSLGSLDGQDETESHVWARLAKPKARLRLTVSEKGEPLGRATVKLTRRPAPASPRAGAWVAPGVDFTIRGGKVRGFRINTRTTCGGYPDMPTTTNNTYSFQTESIPRNNEVVGTERGNQGGDAAYVAYLDLEFVSRTKAVGKFSYYGPARCTAIDGFTAKVKR